MDSQKVLIVFLAICAASVLSKPFTIDIFDSNDSIFRKSGELVKRKASIDGLSNDVAELSVPKISLSALIDNIEHDLVKTALSASNVANDPNSNIPDVTTSQSLSTQTVKIVDVTTPRSVEKIQSSVSADTGVNFVNKPTVLTQTSEKILADEVRPSHVVIDRHTDQVIAAVARDSPQLIEGPAVKRSSDKSSLESVESSASLESSESSEETDKITKLLRVTTSAPVDTSSVSSSSSAATNTNLPSSSTSPCSSSVTSSPTSSPSTQSTTPDTKEKVEKELKEKVAEVAAVPVIMPARV